MRFCCRFCILILAVLASQKEEDVLDDQDVFNQDNGVTGAHE